MMWGTNRPKIDPAIQNQNSKPKQENKNHIQKMKRTTSLKA